MRRLALIALLAAGLAAPAFAQGDVWGKWQSGARDCYDQALAAQKRVDGCTSAITLSNDRASEARDEDVLKLLIYRSDAYFALKDYLKAVADADAAQTRGRYDTQALNMQCWTRAVANVELAIARAACTEAIRINKDDPNPFDSRGLVNLREGRWEEAFNDYKVAAVFLTMPYSRYGAGLAVLAQGQDTARGEALIATALARDPKAGDQLNELGFTPQKMKAIAAAKPKPN